jgi:hypothetical protein
MSSERFIRWQSYTIAQLSFAINLFLGLATAALGFSVSLLIDERFTLHRSAKCFFAGAMLLQLLSMIFGIAAVITRTLDFRYTTRRTRNVERNRRAEENKTLRLKVKRLGKGTWFSFWSQIILFVLGVLSLIVSVFATYGHKLL